jgi:hypothetical protein
MAPAGQWRALIFERKSTAILRYAGAANSNPVLALVAFLIMEL